MGYSPGEEIFQKLPKVKLKLLRLNQSMKKALLILEMMGVKQVAFLMSQLAFQMIY
jgi:hypothetical protein